MCAIIDNNVAGEVFKDDPSSKPSPPAREFHRHICKRKFPVVAGGKLFQEELRTNKNFILWWQQAILSGHGKHICDDEVILETSRLENQGGYRSDDPHVLALARISGARLLFTNDRDLQLDFQNNRFITNPSGKIYTTRTENDRKLRDAHKKMLGRRDLCAIG